MPGRDDLRFSQTKGLDLEFEAGSCNAPTNSYDYCPLGSLAIPKNPGYQDAPEKSSSLPFQKGKLRSREVIRPPIPGAVLQFSSSLGLIFHLQ